MNFSRTEPNEHYRELRLVSAGGGWNLGLSLYASGLRLRMGKAGRPPSVLDFCLGQDPAIYGSVLEAVIGRLEPLAETADAEAIDGVFPWAGTRPDLAVHLEALLAASASNG